MTPTPCSLCDNVHADTRKLPPRQWRCVKFKMLPASHVAPEWLPSPPYGRCEDINSGECPCFTPLRTPDDIQS